MMAKVDAPCRILIRQLQTPLLELRLENATLLSKTPSKEFLVELQPGQSVVRLRPRTFWEMVARTLTRADAG